LEDSVLVAVFPSTFSQNKIKPIITNIKKILKDFLKEFEKISNINKENLEKIINNLNKNS